MGSNTLSFFAFPTVAEMFEMLSSLCASLSLTISKTLFGFHYFQLGIVLHVFLRQKVHRMYTYFYVHHLDEYEWFVRIDDDVLVSMINLREYLSFFDPQSAPYFIGHTLLDRFRGDNIVYNAGNLHVINQLALSMMGPVFMTLPTGNVHDARAHCMDFVAGFVILKCFSL